NHDREDAAGHVHLRDRRLGLWEKHAGRGDRLQGPRPRLPRGEPADGPVRGDRWGRAATRGAPDRPGTDRPDAALEPGDLHQGLRRYTARLCGLPGGETYRLDAWRFLLQHGRRPLRGAPGVGPAEDGDVLLRG